MEQQELNFNYPPPGELFTYGTQDYQLYERLYNGGITNVEIVKDLCFLQYNRGIHDVRKKLLKHNADVKMEKLHGKVYFYKLAPLDDRGTSGQEQAA